MSHCNGPSFRGREREWLEAPSREIRRLILVRNNDMMETQRGDDNQCDGKGRKEPGAYNEPAAEVRAQEDCYDRGENGISDRQGEDDFWAV